MGSYVYAPHNATYTNLYPKGTGVKFPPKPATQKQIDFIEKLLPERVIHDDVRQFILTQIATSSLTSKLASAEIDRLLKAPKVAKAKPHVEKSEYVAAVEDAYYMDPATSNIFQCKRSKAGHMYAMGLVPHGKKFKWVYVPGAMKDFQTWVQVTIAEAAKFGKKYGHCMVCARLLTNPDSIEAGIGPICAGKF